MRTILLLSVLALLLLLDHVHSAPQHIGRLPRNSSLDDSGLVAPEFESERTEDGIELTSIEDETAFAAAPEHRSASVNLDEGTSLRNDDDNNYSTSYEVSSSNSPLEISSIPRLRPDSDVEPSTTYEGTTAGKQTNEPVSTTFFSTENSEPLSSVNKMEKTDVSSVSYIGDDHEKINPRDDVDSKSVLTTLPNHSESSASAIPNSDATEIYDNIDDDEDKELGTLHDDDDEVLKRSGELIEESVIEEDGHHTTSSSLPNTSSEKDKPPTTQDASDRLVLGSEKELSKNFEKSADEKPTVTEGEASHNTTSTTLKPDEDNLEFRNEELEDVTEIFSGTEKDGPVDEVTELHEENKKLASVVFSSSAEIAGLSTDQGVSKGTTPRLTTIASESTEGQTSPFSFISTDSDHFEGRHASISTPPPDAFTDGDSTDGQVLGSEVPKVVDDTVSIITTLDDNLSSLPHISESVLGESPDVSQRSTSTSTLIPAGLTNNADEGPVSNLELTSEGLTTLGHQTASVETTLPEEQPLSTKAISSDTDTGTHGNDYSSTLMDLLPRSDTDLDIGTNIPERDLTSSTSAFETTEGEEHFLELKSVDATLGTAEGLDTNTPPNDRTTTLNLPTTSKELTSTTKEKATTLLWHGPTVLPRQTTTTSSEASTQIDETESVAPIKEMDMKQGDEKDTPEMRFSDRYLSGDNMDMVAAVQFLHYHDKASSEQCFRLVDAHWNYATNLTEENKRKQLQQTLEYSLFHKEAWKNATSFAWKSFNDTLLRRWFKSLSILGNAALPEDKLTEFNQLKAEMKNTYSTAKVCPYIKPEDRSSSAVENRKCSLSLEPDLQSILMKSRDYDELVHVWKAWRDAAGKPIRDKFLRFVNLSNEAATLNGFPDTGDMWREAYESDSFQQDLDLLWEQLRPLYEHLHAYVRRKLINQYGDDKIKENGPIPAHLFGNMWAQSWVSLLDITQPFPGKPSVDVTSTMEATNMTALDMFKVSEEFFTSLGLKPMPEEFWKYSLIEKPKDREIICHASAWDFCNGKDYRIKQCTDITMEDLITVHHEMGHIQYFLQYARQPNVFREGANPGFHEAIGDVLALSVSTPKHLLSIGLLDEIADDPEGDLNFLLRTALEKVSFLPSGYLIDLWRWGLFSGEIKFEEMNTKWWELRLKYQGICPPVKRTEEDFDPGAKYHVAGNVPYIRYFVSFVIQFQFHKVLCDAAGHTGPLYKCDIYKSKEAGQILSQVMELGSSEHWSEAMRIMTGGAQTKMDAQPIMEYFEPLLNWLIEQNKNETLGWRSDDATLCP